jgi:hypothetical protein
MVDRSTSVRGFGPASAGYMQQSSPIQSMWKMVDARNLKGLEAALKRETLGQGELHSLLFKACHEDAAAIVETLIRQPAYTPNILATIVVDALE